MPTDAQMARHEDHAVAPYGKAFAPLFADLAEPAPLRDRRTQLQQQAALLRNVANFPCHPDPVVRRQTEELLQQAERLDNVARPDDAQMNLLEDKFKQLPYGLRLHAWHQESLEDGARRLHQLKEKLGAARDRMLASSFKSAMVPLLRAQKFAEDGLKDIQHGQWVQLGEYHRHIKATLVHVTRVLDQCPAAQPSAPQRKHARRMGPQGAWASAAAPRSSGRTTPTSWKHRLLRKSACAFMERATQALRSTLFGHSGRAAARTR